MDTIKRLNELMKKKNWSDYKLAKESGLSSSTIANIRRRNTVPSIATLEIICNSLGITLSDFFSEPPKNIQMNKELEDLFQLWLTLTESQKKLIMQLIKEFR